MSHSGRGSTGGPSLPLPWEDECGSVLHNLNTNNVRATASPPLPQEKGLHEEICQSSMDCHSCLPSVNATEGLPGTGLRAAPELLGRSTDSWSLNAVRTESHPECKGKQKMLLLCGPCQRKPSPFRLGEPAWGWGHKRCSRHPFWEQVLPDRPGERASRKGRRQAHLERRLLYGEAGRPSGTGGSQAHTHQNLLGQIPVPPQRFPFRKAGRSLRIHISRKSPDNTEAETAEGPLPR